MEIKRLNFEKQEIEIKETYLDADGSIKERIVKVNVPTGKCLDSLDQKKDTVE